MSCIEESCVVVLAALCIAPIGTVFECAATPASAVDNFSDAWKRRQATVTSARFKWTTQRTDAQGAYTAVARRADPKLDAFPPVDTTYLLQEELAFDNARGRYRLNGSVWDFTRKKLVPRDELRVLGRDSMTTLSESIEGVRGRQGGVYKREHPFSLMTARPILYCFRPFVENLGGLQEIAIKTLDDSELDGVNVAVIEDNRGLRFYLDRDRDYIVLRHSGRRSDGEPRFQLDIDYDRTDEGFWIPSSWRFIEYAHESTARMVMSCKVVEYALNIPLPPELFEIEFPKGTHVFDQRTRNDYVVGQTSGSPHISTRRWLPIAVLFCLIVAALIAVAIRRRRATLID